MSTTTNSNFGRIVDRASGTIYTTGVIFGFLTAFAITSATWLTLFGLDNLLSLPPAMRFPLALLGGAITIGCFWKFVIGSLMNRRSHDDVALMLEKKFGIEENLIINTVQFEEMQYGEQQQDFVQATASAASQSWQHVPLRELWQVGRMSAWWAVFALLLALWVGYLVIAPESVSSAFTRYAFSLSAAPATEVTYLEVTPGQDVTIAEYENLEITLDVEQLTGGTELMTYPAIFHKEGMSLVADYRGDGSEVKMGPVVGKPNLYTYSFQGVRRSFAFRVFVDDTYSRSIQVTVNPAPKIVQSRFSITPPAYLAQAAREQAGPPSPVECLPHAKLAIRIKLDKPVDWLRWQWAAGEIEFEKTGDLAWKANIDVGDSAGRYDLVAKAENLETPIHLTSGAIMLKTDRQPDVKFIDTDMSHVVFPGGRVLLKIEARDDYGLGELQLTSRRALSGSRPKQIKQWAFGKAPGAQGKVDKRTELSIDASEFVPGNKYFIEARAKDFCPSNPWAVSEPILITVKSLKDRLKAPEGSNLDALYAALEQAIQLQKQALNSTRNLKTNIDDVWMDLNRNQRTAAQIQGILDKSRERNLSHQLQVREALIRGVNANVDKKDRLAIRMWSISQIECGQANDQTFAVGRARVSAGELKPVGGLVKGVSFRPDQQTQTAVFESRPARYFGLVVNSVHSWKEAMHLRSLSLLDDKGKPLNSSGWKVVSAGELKNADKAFTPQGVGASVLPRYLVCDMGAVHEVSGIACAGKHEQAPKGFALYVSEKSAPKLVIAPPDQKYVLGELKLLEMIQESIYNQLVALKGGTLDEIAAKKEELIRIALGEEGEEPAPAVDQKLEDLKEKLKEWLEENEKNIKERKLVMSIPTLDLTDDDRQKLVELNLEKRKLARELEKMVDDLARAPWDQADETQVKNVEETLHKFGELSDLVNAAAKKQGTAEASWNLDTQALAAGKELDTGQAPPRTGSSVQPGHSEDPEDHAASSKLGALPSELPVRIMDLAKSLAEMEFPEESGSQTMDHANPMGGQTADNLDSATAAGQMTDQTPNPKKTIKGRGNVGRAGRADGQMVMDKIPAIPNNEVKMPPRMSSSSAEKGGANDQGNIPATAIGLGKGTGSPSDFAKSGKLPPDQLKRLRDFAGQSDETRENARALLLNLERHNLPTTDLRRALRRMEQINRGKEGLDVRQVLSEAEGHVRAANSAVATAIELHQQELTADQNNRAHDSARDTVTVPDGFEDLLSEYFKAVADKSANRK